MHAFVGHAAVKASRILFRVQLDRKYASRKFVRVKRNILFKLDTAVRPYQNRSVETFLCRILRQYMTIFDITTKEHTYFCLSTFLK